MRVIPVKLYCALALLVALIPFSANAETDVQRFGGREKTLAYAVLLGSGRYTGSVGSQATFDFTDEINADDLFGAPQTIALEYSESLGKSSLATGLEITRVDELNALSEALGLSTPTSITVSYVDIPITYRVNAYAPGRGQFNVFAGLGLVAMFDFLKADDDIFLTDGGTASSSGGASNKHVDFGLGLGGEFGAEFHVRGALYLTGRAGFRSPFTGVTRPKAGFAQLGFRWFEF